jgi:hypothetical protein
MRKKLKMVLAGNRQQFEDFLGENGLTDSDARYVFEARSILGRGHDYEIVLYGTYYEHPRYRELRDMLEKNQDIAPTEGN